MAGTVALGLRTEPSHPQGALPEPWRLWFACAWPDYTDEFSDHIDPVLGYKSGGGISGHLTQEPGVSVCPLTSYRVLITVMGDMQTPATEREPTPSMTDSRAVGGWPRRKYCFKE